jgi:hypothetical protein
MKDFWTMIAAFLRSFGTMCVEAIALLQAGVVVIKTDFKRLALRFSREPRWEGRSSDPFLISIAQAALALLLFFINHGYL